MTKKRRRRRNPAQCPCGSGKRYRTCCGRFHRGDAVAETPVELMRSRYAAYAKEEVDYVVETTDPNGPVWQEPLAQWRADIRRFGRDTEFVGVDILDTSVDGDRAEVEFRAKLRSDGRDTSFVERSEFVRREGRWFYWGGEVEGPD